VKTVTFERVIYEKILWVKGSKDSQTINGEIMVSRRDDLYFWENSTFTFTNDGDFLFF